MAERRMGILAGRRVLVVEDEYIIAMDLAFSLEAMGADVVGPVGSVDEALKLIAETKGSLDGAILDLNLGGERAYPVAEMLRSLGIPFVFASGYDAGVTPDDFGEIPRCAKPIDKSLVARLLVERFNT